MDHTQARFNAVPGALTVAGGAIAVIGCLLPWGELSPGQSGLFSPETSNAIDESPFDLGWFALAAGMALVAAGIVLLFLSAPPVWRVIGEVAIVVGLVPILVGGYNVATKDRKVDEIIRNEVEESTGQRLTDPELDRFRAELERIGIEVTLELGVYLTILGGLVGVAGGLIALRAGKPQPAVPGGPSGLGPEEDRTT